MFVVGAAIPLASLAPLWGRGPETSTLTIRPPPASPAAAGPAAPASPAAPATPDPALLDQPVNGVDFDMSVPAIGYSATVREGVDLGTLEYGPGHYPTTAWPGSPGIVAIAAHNVYWINFGQLKPGDRIEIQTRRGIFDYRLTGSEVVDPNDRDIIVPGVEHRLVMTTCWPLWAGAFATQRLIFFATETSQLPRPS